MELPEAGSQKPDQTGPEAGAGSWKLEAGPDWILDTGYWILHAYALILNML